MGVDVQSAAGGVPPGRTLTAAGLVTGGGDLSANRTFTVTAAVQSDQETASSTSVAVVPGVQQFHPSAVKFWGFATVSGGTPTLQVSYNVTSITDTALGRLTVTIATDFSSANWAPWIDVEAAGAGNEHSYITLAAGSIEYRFAQIGTAFVDPGSWSFGGFGDQ